MKLFIFIAKKSVYPFPIPTAMRWVVNQSRLIKVQYIDFNKYKNFIFIYVKPISALLSFKLNGERLFFFFI